MRNLKKFLALVLAMMMVMGFMVTANAATTTADFKDGNAVDAEHREAMDVMAALNIMGDTGGNKLSPDATFDRAQLATMIYKIKSGDSAGTNPQVEFYKNETVFGDVVPGKWYTKYVNYVGSMEWMVGIGNGNFAPDRTVTVSEVVVAMVNVLDMGLEDGAAWIEKITAAADNGLLEGTDGLSGNATRQVAAQIIFNAMKYSPSGGTGKVYLVKVDNREGETLYLGGDLTEAIMIQDHAGDDPSRNKLYVEDGATDTLFATVYNVMETSDHDKFGRPATTWYDTVAQEAIITTAKPADKTFNGTFTKKDYEALSKDKGEDYKIFYNGVNDEDYENPRFVPYAMSEGENEPAIDGKAVKGFEIEIYKAEKRIIVREAVLAEVAEANEDDDNSITVTGYARSAANNPEEFDITVSEEADIYPALSLYQGGYAAVYFKGGAVEAAEGEADDAEDYVLEVAALDKPVTAKITLVVETGYAATTTVTAGGKVYGLNNMFMVKGKGADPDEIKQGYPKLGDSKLYKYNGNLLLIDQATETEIPDVGYAYVYDAKKVSVTDKKDGQESWESEGGFDEASSDTTFNYFVRLLLPDGTLLSNGVKVSKIGGEDVDDTDTDSYYDNTVAALQGSLVYYEIDSKGNYELTAFAGVTADSSEGGLEIVNKRSEGLVPADDDNSTNVAFDSKTVFMIVTTKDIDGEKPNYLVVKDAKEIIKSIYNIADTSSDKNTVTVTAVTEIDSKTGESGVLVADDESGKTPIASVVLIRYDDDGPEETGEIYFIVDSAAAPVYYTYAEDGKTQIWYKVLNAVVGGEVKTVKVLVNGAAGEYGEDINFGDNGIALTDDVTLNKNGVITKIGATLKAGDGFEGVGLTTDEKVIIDVAAVGPFKNDRIDLTDDDDAMANYLVSNAVKAVFEYSTVDGSIKALDPAKDINTQKAAEKFTDGYAVVDGDTLVDVLYSLFITKDAAD